MRKMDWEKPLSEEDIAWLRQAGFMSEERIAAHQAQFDKEVPEVDAPEDELTRSALDAAARVAEQIESDGAPVRVVPEQQDPAATGGDFEDDYDSWKKSELEAEVTARNAMPDTTEVTVEGTGKDGAVLKEDLVKGLRLWDNENPDALKD